MKKKILFVVTSHDHIGNTLKATGYHMAEVSHPWKVLTDAGYEIDFVSPQGGKAPIDAFDLDDPINKEFWEDEEYNDKVTHTMLPPEIDTNEYDAIYFAGGHGAMWDFPGNQELEELAVSIYEKGGVVAAVCHGPAALVNMKLTDGRYFIDGKKINAFTNEEEVAVGLETTVPFLLESALIAHGADFEKTSKFQSHVVTDGRVVTGQNPASATAVGEALLKALQKIDEVGE